MKPLRLQWWLKGTLGAIFLGSGISGAIESGFLKHSGSPLFKWAAFGTLSLALIVSGVVLLVQAGILIEKLKNQA